MVCYKAIVTETDKIATILSSYSLCLLLGRKALTNLDSILKSQDIVLLTMVYILKTMVFPVATYRYESQPIKNAEEFMLKNQRTYTFKLW